MAKARARGEGWSSRLERVVLTRVKPHAPRARAITTLGEARAYALDLPAGLSARRHWQRLAELLIEASESGDTAAATRQLELALLLDGLLGFA